MINILKDISLVFIFTLGLIGMLYLILLAANKLIDLYIDMKYGWNEFVDFVREKHKTPITYADPNKIKMADIDPCFGCKYEEEDCQVCRKDDLEG